MKPTEYRKIPESLKKGGTEKVSILMPFLNEAEVIVQNALNAKAAMDDLGLNAEIVLIDDGSTDGSLGLLKAELSEKEGFVLCGNVRNFGKGFALKTGFEYSSGDFILFLDSDLELSPYHLPNFLRILFETKSDACIGSKMHEESNLEYPILRKIYSKGYYFLIRILFGLPVMDTQTGIKLFRREALEKTLPRLVVKKFAFDIELLMLFVKFGLKLSYAPIELNFSRENRGRIKIKTIINMFQDTLAIFYRDKILGFYTRPLGENVRYKYTAILFGDRMDEDEQHSLRHFLEIDSPGFSVLLCSTQKPAVSDKRIRWTSCGEKHYSKRLETVIKQGLPESDYFILSSLRSYPDARFLQHAGRVLSVDQIAAVGGYHRLKHPHTKFEHSAFLALSSFFLNVSLFYRYKSAGAREVSELDLDGMIVERSALQNLDFSHYSSIKLERLISNSIAENGQKMSYSPDFILYSAFPKSPKEFYRHLTDQALLRGKLSGGRKKKNYAKFSGLIFWIAVLFLAFLISSVFVAIYFSNLLFLVPLGAYYGVLLLSMLIFHGIKKGFISFFLISTGQIVYGAGFLKGLFSRRK